MARANFARDGFSFYKPKGAQGFVEPVPCQVATAYGTALYVGQPVQWVSDGSVALSAANSGSIYGVITAILQYRNADGVLVRNARYLPASTSYTADSERSMVMVAQADTAYFVVDGDDATSLTTIANARAVVGENADHIFGTADTSLGLPATSLDISTHAVTATLQWRIEGILEQPGNDVVLKTAARFVVSANLLSQRDGLPAVLGV
jgi:hypothetical protein